MSLLEKARRLESRIAARLDSAAQGFARSGSREPIEILHAVLEAAAHQVQPGGRGTRVFPFNRIAVTVVASSPAARAQLEALFDGAPPLRDRILQRLRSRGCDAADFGVEVKYVPRMQKAWRNPDFHVAFARIVAREPAAAAAADRKTLQIELTVVTGVANHRKRSFAAARVDLGRCEELRDSRHRLIRRNDLAFAEDPATVNNSVSRQHAHLSYAAATGCFRVHDDGSAHGTSVVRTGRMIAVPTGSRGVRLQSGDEILLGDACLRVRIHSD